MNKAAWILFALSLVPLGCTSVNRSTVTEMRWTDGQRTFSYRSPKDTTVARVHFDTVTGVFVISNLATQVDQAAVNAAAAARIADAQIVTQALDLAKQSGAIAAKAAIP